VQSKSEFWVFFFVCMLRKKAGLLWM
jgi:hypothetical protein